MDIDGDLNYAKESLTPQSSHPGDLSLQFLVLQLGYKKDLVIIQHLHL